MPRPFQPKPRCPTFDCHVFRDCDRADRLIQTAWLKNEGDPPPPPHNEYCRFPLLTGIQLWAHIRAHLNFELRDRLVTFPIFVPSQRLIARNVRELFSFNRGVSQLNEACRIDDVSRGSLLCYEILANN
jgi:hypothetical protein